MLFHENRLLANIIPYFFRKLREMSQSLSSAAVVICPLMVKLLTGAGSPADRRKKLLPSDPNVDLDT